VRVVAAEVGADVELIDANTDAGQTALQHASPIQKVPVAVVEDRTIFDSRVIIDWLTTTHGFGTMAAPGDRWRELNLVNAIDAALDSVIQLYYLRLDGVPCDGTEFARRELERTSTIFNWLVPQVDATTGSFCGGFGLAELSLICALDWMDLRGTYPTTEFRAFALVREQWAQRSSIAATRPDL
jgi:glutathione S-transferase